VLEAMPRGTRFDNATAMSDLFTFYNPVRWRRSWFCCAPTLPSYTSFPFALYSLVTAIIACLPSIPSPRHGDSRIRVTDRTGCFH